MTTTRIDYAATYFPYSSPTPIRGEPTYKSLKNLVRELKANASSVDSDLGGGDHGYLGLVLSDTEYEKICPGNPFEAPKFPDPLYIPPGTNPAEAIQLREEYRTNIAFYRECREVEKALLRHITKAIESKYIDFLKNPDTDLIEKDIPEVLEFLFSNYGVVPTQEVKEKEHEVLNTPFVPSDPMLTIYKPIEDLRTLAEIAQIPYTESQIVDFGIHLIKNTRDFELALATWNTKPRTEKTWEGFKKHFHNAQKILKDIRGPTMKQAGFHHANHLAAEIREELRESQMKMLALAGNTNYLEDEEQNVHQEAQPFSQNNANAIMQNSIQYQTAELLKSLQKDLKLLSEQLKGNQNSKKRPNKKTPDNPTFTRTDTSKYCWTHGACNHNSNECSRQATGHKKEATKTNKMGGSTAFCA